MQALFERWGITITPEAVVAYWNGPGRFYHSLSHLDDLLRQIREKEGLSAVDVDKLTLAAIFHDIIYDPQASDNEEKSAELLLKHCSYVNDDIQDVVTIILDTQTHKPSSALSAMFSAMDMDIMNRSLDELLVWEEGIRKEYQPFVENYLEKRLAFLEKYAALYPKLHELIDVLTAKN